MKKFVVLVAGAAVSAAMIVAGSGSAEPTGVRILTLFENTAGESNKLVDNAPKSPATNPASRRFRLSRGDLLIARTPVFDREGGTRVGTSYAQATVASGRKFEHAVLEGQVVLSLRDGDLTLAGLAGAAQTPFAVTGGTGAYEGARGQATERETHTGAVLTIRLLP